MLKEAPQTHLVYLEEKFMSHPILTAEVYCRVLILSAALLLAGVLAVRFGGAHVFIEAHAQNEGTRLLRAPTVSATQIAFAYAQNIWVVPRAGRSEEHTSELQSHSDLVCRLLLEKKNKQKLSRR